MEEAEFLVAGNVRFSIRCYRPDSSGQTSVYVHGATNGFTEAARSGRAEVRFAGGEVHRVLTARTVTSSNGQEIIMSWESHPR